MPEEKVQNANPLRQPADGGGKKGKRWQFWFLVALSLLFIVTFVFYLPLRFQFNAQPHEEGMQMASEEQAPEQVPEQIPEAVHGHEEGVEEDHHATEQLKPLVSPEWWLLLAGSLVLMTILSFVIYKFIHPSAAKPQPKTTKNEEKSKKV